MDQVQTTNEPGALVAVPSVAPGGLAAAVAPHFGRCTCFTLARVGPGVARELGVVEKPPNAGCQMSVALLRERGVQVLLCQHLGLQPYEACRASGIAVLTTSAPEVSAALLAYSNRQALPFDASAACQAHSGQHHGGAQAGGHGAGHGHGPGNCGR